MQAAIDVAYRDVAARNGAFVVPAGEAWDRVTREAPGIALWQADGSHPTVAGTYLAACVLYASLAGRSPVGLAETGGLPAADAATLQRFGRSVVPPRHHWHKAPRRKRAAKATRDGCRCLRAGAPDDQVERGRALHPVGTRYSHPGCHSCRPPQALTGRCQPADGPAPTCWRSALSAAHATRPMRSRDPPAVAGYGPPRPGSSRLRAMVPRCVPLAPLRAGGLASRSGHRSCTREAGNPATPGRCCLRMQSAPCRSPA